jgi:signal transduction histidine kinase
MDPPFEHFHSIRLESYQPKKKNEFIKGIICVMDNKPMNTPLISTILNTVHDRCINELNQLQTQEQLISARDLALLDAENKLKFLADMSHEIR